MRETENRFKELELAFSYSLISGLRSVCDNKSLACELGAGTLSYS